MVNCKDCKWWGRRPDYLETDEPYVPGIPREETHKNCEHPKVGGGSYMDYDRARNDSLNSYEAIGTGPNFGCVHGER